VIDLENLSNLMEEYWKNSRAELEARWAAWPLDLSKDEVHEVVGALLARQVSLANGIIHAPLIWTGHVAPIVLRTMVDTHITLVWICGDSVERSRRFIHYGLGQTKLDIEHRKAQWNEREPALREKTFVDALEDWLNSQRWSFLTEVDVGRWSGTTTRKMAEECDLLDFYNYCYMPFSAATHSMWHHVAKYNLARCKSPLHRHHHIPVAPDLPWDPYYAELAAKYMNRSFRFFDEQFSVRVEVPNSYETLQVRLREVFVDEETSGERSREEDSKQ